MENNLNLNLLDGLTPEKLLEIEAQMLGYEKLPPTIEEFIESPYYLGGTYGSGKLYKYWKPILQDIFPDPITTNYSVLVLTGCIGSGKSTISRLIALYTYCRLDHLRNFDFFGLSKGKNYVFSFFHTTTDNVENTFLDPFEVIKNDSPYFSTGLLNAPTIENKADTPRGSKLPHAEVILH